MSDTPKPHRTWRNVLLVVSLCLNIALVAGIVGVVERVIHRDTSPGSGPGPFAPRNVMAQFPDAAPAIHKLIAAHAARIVALRHDSAQARRDAFRAFAAPDYAPDKLAHSFAAITAADGALEAEAVRLEAESLIALSPADRQALIEHVRRRNNSWWFRMFRQGQ